MSDRRADQANYVVRKVAGKRVYHPELHEENTDALLLGLGYLDPMTEYTRKDADAALAKLVELVGFMTRHQELFEKLLECLRDANHSKEF